MQGGVPFKSPPHYAMYGHLLEAKNKKISELEEQLEQKDQTIDGLRTELETAQRALRSLACTCVKLSRMSGEPPPFSSAGSPSSLGDGHPDEARPAAPAGSGVSADTSGEAPPIGLGNEETVEVSGNLAEEAAVQTMSRP